MNVVSILTIISVLSPWKLHTLKQTHEEKNSVTFSNTPCTIAPLPYVGMHPLNFQ